MVGDVAVVLAQVVIEHHAECVNHSHSQIWHAMRPYIFVHRLAAVVPIHSQCLLHIDIKALQALVERLYLILFLAVLLKHDEEYGKYSKQREDTKVYPPSNGHFHFFLFFK